ncbi:hypothetical protein BDR22DRAFT_892787 [Usnea florida]
MTVQHYHQDPSSTAINVSSACSPNYVALKITELLQIPASYDIIRPPGYDLVPLSETPAGITPPGVTPNFSDPQTLVPALIAVNLVMILWTISFVVIRIYVNFHARRGLSMDDYFCIIATVLAFACTGLVFALSKYARHDYDIPESWLDGNYRKLSYTISMFSGPTSFFSKSTILLLYLRIFAIDKRMRYCIWFGLTWTLLLYWLAVPLNTVFCIPRYGDSLNLEEQSKPCSNLLIYTLIQGPLGILLDLYIFLLPIPIVLRLQISQKRRLSLLGIFGTAFLGITAAVVGTVYRVKAYRSTSNDWSWAGASLQICIIVENYIAIIVSSMPAFASFFNTSMPGTSCLTTLHSLVTRLKRALSSYRNNHPYTTKSPDQSSMIEERSVPDHSYLELHDVRLLRGFGSGGRGLRVGGLGDGGITFGEGSVKTEIEGMRMPGARVEEGVVHKTVVLRQEAAGK